MKWFIIILLVVLSSCVRVITITEAEIKQDVFYTTHGKQPFTGKCHIVYSDTALVKEEFTYRKGLLHGEAIAWYKNGNMRRRGRYMNGQISGKWEFWDMQGHKSTEANFENDTLHGHYVTLYANGTVKEQGEFAHNQRVGKWMYYNEAGQCVKTETR
jgi:antitoxin component YwqK of YwqJK toxin-antitoxin module